MSTKKQPIDQALIRQLAMLLNETDLTEIEVEHEDLRIRVARQVTVTTIAPVSAMPQGAPADEADQPEPIEVSTAEQGLPVPSPMVGTAYLSPKPGDPAFINVGDRVREGQTLMIIEAMKHMNQIASPRTARVLEILVEDGRPVEFGEPLIILSRD